MVSTLTALLLVAPPLNALTPQEKAEGWTLLFNGQNMEGWLAFGGKAPAGPGWAVKEGVMRIEEPGTAGDIVSQGVYKWFELKLDFRLEPGQNSGVMFHVGDKGEATWHSGPEVQIYDHQGADWAEQTGWLYQLYKPEASSAKPIGEWNTLEMRIAKDRCQVKLNGVLYYTFQLGSPDFKARVAKSKFKDMPDFGKLGQGRIAIQGDHGHVSFRNIKIKPLKG